MKKKRVLTMLLMMLTMLFAFSACGQGGDDSSEPKESAESSKEEASMEESQSTGGAGSSYEGTAEGYGGDIKVNLTLEGKEIKSIEAEAEGETPTIGGAAIEDLINQVIASQSTKIDTITGATNSSKGFLEAVNKALEAAGIDPDSLEPKQTAAEEMKLDYEADVVVVGAGGAGLTAAITATEQGKTVVLVEKAPNVGGNSNRATGGMNATETHYQKEQGIEDTVETFIEDTMKGGHDLNNPDLVRVLAEKSSDSIDWLDSIGAELSDVGKLGGATNARSHRPVDENGKILSVGSYLVEKLLAKAEELGITIIYNAEVNEIMLEDGKAAGIKAQAKDGILTVKAPAVIVASGGFGGSDEMVSKYRPDLKGYVSTNAPTIEGDAIAFLEAIKADFVDMDQIQTHPTVVQKDGSLISESLRGDGAILLNKEGIRFINEMETRDTVSAAINEQTEKTAWLVVDQAMFDDSNVVKKYVDKGLLTKCEDIQAIADMIGSDAAVIEKTLTDWAGYIAAGEDPDCGRKNVDQIKYNLSQGPYYVGPVGPGIHHTMGGVKINVNAEVIDVDGNVIPGVFAAGEVTGGVHGRNRLGGNAVSDIITFGRIAGESAVKYTDK